MKQKNVDVLARMVFVADAMVAKMKKCLEKSKHVTPRDMFRSYPAIEMQTGVLVASEGHVMAVHKLKDYRFKPDDNVMLSEMAVLPVEVLQMKGRIEVTLANEGGDTVVTVTDEKGNKAALKQTVRYPRWRSVVHSCTGSPIAVDCKAWDVALKEIVPKLDSNACPVRLVGEHKSETLSIAWENYDINEQGSYSMNVGYMPHEMFVVMNGKRLRDMLAFGPKEMRFVDSTRAVLFLNDETFCMLMPLLLDAGRHCSVDRGSLEQFDIDKWVGADLGKVVCDNRAAARSNGTTELRNSGKAKAANPEPLTVNPEPTLADRLRAALLKQFGKAA